MDNADAAEWWGVILFLWLKIHVIFQLLQVFLQLQLNCTGFIKTLYVRGEGCGKGLYLEGIQPGGRNCSGVDRYRILGLLFWVSVVKGKTEKESSWDVWSQQVIPCSLLHPGWGRWGWGSASQLLFLHFWWCAVAYVWTVRLQSWTRWKRRMWLVILM